jgi:hypothetical protein
MGDISRLTEKYNLFGRTYFVWSRNYLLTPYELFNSNKMNVSYSFLSEDFKIFFNRIPLTIHKNKRLMPTARYTSNDL